MSDPFYTGQISVFGFGYAPQNWAFCDGRLVPIQQNVALFSLLGTYYGGDGTTTYALPNFFGTSPCGAGQGVGLSSYVIGETFGTDTVTLNSIQLPQHNHGLQALLPARSTPRTGAPASSAPGSGLTTTSNQPLYANGTANAPMASGTIGLAGGSNPHENRQPFIVMNYSICIQGVFPPRP